jgi:hypothetical protein
MAMNRNLPPDPSRLSDADNPVNDSSLTEEAWDARVNRAISDQLLLDIFAMPVSFHRSLIPITGSVTAALFLSHAIQTTQQAEAGDFGAPETDIVDGWFQLSQEQWTRETGLSRWEQATARRALRQAGLLTERREGLPSRLYFKVDKEAVSQAMHRQAIQNAIQAVHARIEVLQREEEQS